MADPRQPQKSKFGNMSIADIINVTRNPPSIAKSTRRRTKKLGTSFDEDKPINPLSLTSRYPLSCKIEYLIDNKHPKRREIIRKGRNPSSYDKYIGPGYYNTHLPSPHPNTFTFSRTSRFSEKFEDMINCSF